jgi:hypothetical protein
MGRERNERIHQEVYFFDEDFKISLQNKQSSISERAFHEAIEIKLFYEGRVMQMIDEQVIVSEPGDITVTNPYEVHTNMEPKLYDGRYYLLNVDPDLLATTNPKGIDLRYLLIAKGTAFGGSG